MNINDLLQLFSQQWRRRARNGWTRPQVCHYQQEALKALRAHAYAHSPFYQRFHRGRLDSPLAELPVLTKSELMANWDEAVIDKSVKLRDVQEFLTTLKKPALFRNQYYVASTAGSTGLKGIFIYTRREWQSVLLSYLRASDWGGLKLNPFRRLKTALVTTVTPWHQSALVAATLDNWFVPTVCIDSTQTIADIISQLNHIQPACLVAYASVARLLAQAQIDGDLKITPQYVFCTSEVLTRDARGLITKAWGISPVDVYGATETAGIASSCTRRHGLHLYEDLVIPEIVDDNNRPVPPGEYGARLLVTVLFSRTLPLIRYEISDSLRLAVEEPDDLPFALAAEIQGRREDIIYMTGATGQRIATPPNVFHFVMETMPVSGWQITQEVGNRLCVSVLGPQSGFSEKDLIEALQAELVKRGVVTPEVAVEYVDTLEKRALGKAYLIKARKD